MLKMQIIGSGAAGNKAVIDLIKSNLMDANYTSFALINSTDFDIPAEYRNISTIFGKNNIGGCGKERNLGKDLYLEDENNGARALDNIIDINSDVVVVAGSTEGGTGSATVPIITKYITQVLHIPTIAVLFFGFNADARGMQNSIEVCQELGDDIGVISICNSKFMGEANGNNLKAEKLANDKFCKIMRTISGRDIRESYQNIDANDLRKVVLTPGYMSVEEIPFKAKTRAQYDDEIAFGIAESKSMDSPSPSAKRIAVIYDVKPAADYVDYNAGMIKEHYGMPYEIFSHVQTNSNSEKATMIISGQKLPTEEVKEIYDEYLRTSARVDKEADGFFDEMNSLKGNAQDSMFNMLGNNKNKPTQKDRDDFFSSFGKKDPSPSEKKKEASGPVVKNTRDVKSEY